MSPSGEELAKVGAYGATVAVVKRSRGSLVLRFTKGDGKQTFKALGHFDVQRAKKQARALSKELAALRASNSGAPGALADLTVRGLFARYTLQVSRHKKGTQPKEDERRRVLWLAFLGPDRKAMQVTPADVREFIARRTKGDIVVDDLKLKKMVKPRTVDADVVWLQSVYNWAYNEARLIDSNPLRGSIRPAVTTQLRPMATPARAAKLLEFADQVHPRFALLLTCVRYLGWRISAVCGIDGFDINRTVQEHAPYGLIRKNWAIDKEGVGDWLPIPKPVRAAFDAAGVIGKGPVFPSPKQKDPKKQDQPMSRFYARELLERCEKLADLKAIDGGDWHPYRRLWATERKTLPVADTADAAGWKDQRTIQKYQQRDPATLAKVMLFEAPEAPATPTNGNAPTEVGATTGTQGPKNTRRGGRASA